MPPLTRRRFLARLSIGLSALGAGVAGIPLAGFFGGMFFRKPKEAWRPVGKIADFAIGKTVAVTFENAEPLPWAGVSSRTAAWLRRAGEMDFIAFDIHCTHLGCPVTWLPGPELFMCPCHGGVYSSEGAVVGGPPPRALARHEVRVRGDAVEILTRAIVG